jgi:hypothetical protein
MMFHIHIASCTWYMQLIFQEKEREAMAVMDKESHLREAFDVRERQKDELGREIEEISTQIEHTLVPAYTRLQQSNLSYRCVTPFPLPMLCDVMPVVVVVMMMMMSILTSAISASCSFYSYTPHFPSSISIAFLHYTLHYSHRFSAMRARINTAVDLFLTQRAANSMEDARDALKMFQGAAVKFKDRHGELAALPASTTIMMMRPCDDEYTNLFFFSAVSAAFYSYTPHPNPNPNPNQAKNEKDLVLST